MKLDLLVMIPDADTDTERSTFGQAAVLASKNRVRVVGVKRTADRPHHAVPKGVGIEYLLDARKGDRDAGPSVLVPNAWGATFSADTDRALARYLTKTNADVVVTSTPALAALAVEFAPTHVPIVHQEHRASAAIGEAVSPLLSHGPRLDAIVSTTEQRAQWLRANLGEVTPPIWVIPHSLEAGFRPRSSLQNRIIIAAGDLTLDSRFAELIKAFKTVNELVPGWRLRIYGDGPLKTALKQAAWRAGLAGQVDIIAPSSRMGAELSKASIFAQTSSVDGQPMVAIEAAAAGLPAVTFDIPSGASEIVAEYGGGLLVPDAEHESFGATLAHLMSDQEALQAYSARAREAASAYAAESYEPRWEDLYRTVRRNAPRRQLNGTRAKVATVGEQDHGVTPPAPAHSGVWLDQPSRGSQAVRQSSAGIAKEIRVALMGRGVAVVRIGSAPDDRRVGVDQSALTDVIECIEQILTAHQLSCAAQRGDNPLHVAPWSSPHDRPATLDFATVFRVVDPEMDPAHAPSIVDVELWRSDADGTRFAPRQNALVEWVDKETWGAWSTSGAGTPTGEHAWNVVDFPIDAVFTWVDGADPEWDARRRAHMAADGRWADLGEDHDAVSAARFVSRDEIYYSVANVRRHLPWIRDVYIVTAGQRHQGIAADFPDVRFIDHADIFPNQGVLPVFNSRAIESCVHRIPGLAEHFIYFNDDVMVTKPLNPEAFFQGNGAAKFFPSNLQINFGANDDAPHLQAASNNRALILRDFGVEITQTMLHTPHPHRRSVLLELEERYAEQFASTRSSKFRSANDLSTLSSLAQYYGWATGQYVIGSLNYRYLRLTGGLLRYRMATILQDDALEVVALGEPHAEDTRHPDERGIVKEFLELLTGVTRKVE